jgi:hypothetical protein
MAPVQFLDFPLEYLKVLFRNREGVFDTFNLFVAVNTKDGKQLLFRFHPGEAVGLPDTVLRRVADVTVKGKTSLEGTYEVSFFPEVGRVKFTIYHDFDLDPEGPTILQVPNHFDLDPFVIRVYVFN